MFNDNEEKDNKKIILKVVIPFLLMCVVFGIWIYKNSQQPVTPDSEDVSEFSLYVTEEIDLDNLKSYGLPIILDFGADSCIPCKKMAPVLKELNEELRGKVIVKFVDVWKYQSLAADYPLSLIPTQVFFDSSGNPYNPKDAETMQMKFHYTEDNSEHIFTTHEGGMTKDQLLTVLKEMGME
ncbi:MAG: thioredoxin family protein [Clostridia bacterium]|nr:thioredoxin family protein [Clostridia bacterium]